MTQPVEDKPLLDEKPFWQSKTLWTSAIAAVVPFFPPAAAWVAANPALYSAALSAVFAGLRIITRDRVTIL